jgi:rubredoxin
MGKQNPYEPPHTHVEPGGVALDRRETASGWMVCPQCGSDNVAMPQFTWWGGLAGQKLLNHVKCNACSHTYNGKTGLNNTGKIVIYQLAILLIGGGVLYLLYAR